MNKIKICSPQLGLNPNSNLGGEVHDHFIIQNLAFYGNKVYVYLPQNRPYIKHVNIIASRAPIKHIPAIMFNLLIIPYLFKTYKKQKFNLIRVHNPYFIGPGAVLFKFFYKIPIIATYHLKEENIIFNLINRIIINKFDGIIVVSNYLKKWLINKYKCNPEKIKVIYNGVDNSLKATGKNKKDNKFILLYIGILNDRKNPLFLLKVFEKFQKDNEEAALVICGKGPLKKKIINVIAQKRLKNVTLINEAYGINKQTLINNCDLFLFPSKNEGFGLAIVEAMRCRKPVLAMDNTSIRELVINGYNGFLLPENVEKWVEKIKIFKNDQEKLEKYGQQAYKFSLRFNWETAARETFNYYYNVIQNK